MTTYRIFEISEPDFNELEVKNKHGFPIELMSFGDAVFIVDLLFTIRKHSQFVIVDSHGNRTRIL